MSYPEHLLPKAEYCMIAWRNELREYYLLRSTPDADVLDVETEKVRARYVLDNTQGRDILKDYSTNLWGIFSTADAAIHLVKSERKSYLTGNWTEGETVEPPNDEDFSIINPFGYFFYKIGVIQNFPQPVNLETKPQYTEARCYVIHTPIRANFWHFSVRWKVGDKDVELALSKSERRGLLSLVRTFLIENAEMNTPEAKPMIHDFWYIVK